MALASTTLAAAIGAADGFLTVASATSLAPGRLLVIDQELMRVAGGYVTASTTVPVVRGQNGTAAVAHVITATVVHGLASDFPAPGFGATMMYSGTPVWERVSYTGAANTMVLPKAGVNLHVILNGTTADTFTIPVPTADMTGCRLLISSNGVAQHVLTFTGGLSGAGTDVDVITINATAPASFEFVAVNALWHAICGPAISGTTTKIAGGIA